MKTISFLRKCLLLIVCVCLVSPALAARKLNEPKDEFISEKARKAQETRAENDIKQAYVLACAWEKSAVYNPYIIPSEAEALRISERNKWMEKAAECGLPDAQYKLAVIHEEAKKIKEAVSFYKKAAAQGLVEAQCKMGAFYKTGISSAGKLGASGDSSDVLPKDEAKALSLFAAAAKMNIPEANYQIGLCFEKGIGVPKNKKRAIEFYTKAMKQRHVEAKEALERCQE